MHQEREYAILKQLSGHPNIVEAIDIFPEIHRSRGYLIMEKVDGQSVLDLVEAHDFFEEDKAREIMKKLL